MTCLSVGVSMEDIERVKEARGPNEPLHLHYLTWAGSMFTGDFGNSFRGGEGPQLTVKRIPATISSW